MTGAEFLHCNVTKHPTSAWVIQQLREAFPYDSAPAYLIFDRGAQFNEEVIDTVKSFGIQPNRTSFRSPWQNGVAERWVGNCRRDLLDHVIVLNERHLRRLMTEYVRYYHEDRTHLALAKETPAGREPAERDRSRQQDRCDAKARRAPSSIRPGCLNRLFVQFSKRTKTADGRSVPANPALCASSRFRCALWSLHGSLPDETYFQNNRRNGKSGLFCARTAFWRGTAAGKGNTSKEVHGTPSSSEWVHHQPSAWFRKTSPTVVTAPKRTGDFLQGSLKIADFLV